MPEDEEEEEKEKEKASRAYLPIAASDNCHDARK
jgi:hypothetical protein